MVVVELGQRRRGEDAEEKEEKKEKEATNLKSNNPHLAGGEQTYVVWDSKHQWYILATVTPL